MRKLINYVLKNKYIILIIVLYVLFFLQLRYIFIYDDDFAIKYPLNFDRCFSGLVAWIINILNYFYYHWSGRLVTHFITTTGLSFTGTIFYVIIHPIIVFLMSLIGSKIIKLINNKIDIKKSTFLISLLSISTTIIFARENSYWISAGVPYIWGFTLVLYIFYILFYHKVKNNTINFKRIIVLSILIIIESFMLEQIASIVLGFLFILFIDAIKRKDKKDIYLYFYLGIVAIIGLLGTYFVPGNHAKNLSVDVIQNSAMPFIKIFLNKSTSVFSYIVDKDLMMVYLSFISIILILDWKKNKGKIYNIQYIFLLLITILILINSCYNIVPIFNSTDRFDSWLYTEDYPKYNDYLAIFLIFIIIIYFIFFSKLLYGKLKKSGSSGKILWYFWLISFISIIVPDYIIRYNGSRYCWPFFIVTLIIITYLIQNESKKKISISICILSFFVSYYLFSTYIFGLVFLIIFAFKKEKVIYNYIMSLFILFLFCNHIYTMYMYSENRKIIDYNEKMIINSKDSDNIIVLKEIPYEKEKYGWHLFYSDFNGYHDYYDYLYRFLPMYYNINPYKISIIESKESSYDE